MAPAIIRGMASLWESTLTAAAATYLLVGPFAAVGFFTVVVFTGSLGWALVGGAAGGLVLVVAVQVVVRRTSRWDDQ